MSLRLRIALFAGGVVLVTVLLFSVLLYALAAYGLVKQQNQVLALRGQQTAVYLNTANAASFRSAPAPVPANLATSTDVFTEILDARGTPLWSTGQIGGTSPSVPGPTLTNAAVKGYALATVKDQGVSLRIYLQPWSRPELSLNGYAVAGQPARSVQNSLRGLRNFLFITAALCLLAALGASWFVVGRALRPLQAMAQTADEIGHTQDLGRRLPAAGSRDEIGLLTSSFNSMLQRVQEAYGRLTRTLDAQQRFVADASHELRTPLTTIRNNAGFLVQQPDARPEDRDAALHDIADESERMSRLVQDLLTLARADAGLQLELKPLDLGPVVHDVCRKAQNLHTDRTIDVMGEPSLTVPGNADALTQLLWILVDNATRHTSHQGRITIGLTCHDVMAELSVTDDGSGLAEADLARIFERFYQADAARSGGSAGLGLAIARWIVDQHHGHIRAVNNPGPGATFVVELPHVPNPRPLPYKGRGAC